MLVKGTRASRTSITKGGGVRASMDGIERMARCMWPMYHDGVLMGNSNLVRGVNGPTS